MNIGSIGNRERISYDWWGVLGLVVAIYLAINLFLIHHSEFLTTYVITPILWCLVAAVILRLPKQRPAGKSRFRETLIILAMVVAITQIFVLVMGGMISGFGHSPYSHSPKGVIQNFFYVGSALAGMELTRTWLLNHDTKRMIFLKLGLISLIYALISIPLTQIEGVRAEADSLHFIAQTCLPALAESLLASFLVFAGGVIPALVYMGIIQSFNWFSPILPDLPFMTAGLLGTVIPVMGLVAGQKLYASQHRKPNKPKPQAREKSFPIGWIVVSIIAVLIIWFSVGVFGYSPTVIVSGSMRPGIDVGDIVIVEKVSQKLVDGLAPGDKIEFTGDDGTPIVHRIVSIDKETGDFITKGDANSHPDDHPVAPQDIKGKVVYTVPKIGWVAIGIKQLFIW